MNKYIIIILISIVGLIFIIKFLAQSTIPLQQPSYKPPYQPPKEPPVQPPYQPPVQPPYQPPVQPQLTNTFLIKESNSNNSSSKLYSIFHGNSNTVSCNNYTNMFDILNQPLNTDGNINKCILDSVINLYYNKPLNIGFIIFYNVFTNNKDIKFSVDFKLITLFQNTKTVDVIEMRSPTMDIQYYDNFTGKNISNINIKYDNNGFSWTDTSKQDDITKNVYKKITNVFAFSIAGLNYTHNYLIIGNE